ncbi:MAG TPA: HAD-IB family hydrolase [Gaiellaceae bacterium]|nr:HAD-IB family hydrolase [Gaiellaceae bacterium]
MPSASGPPPVVAAFDVDGTLTIGDCVTPFLRRAAGRRLWTTLLRHPLALVASAAHRDRDRLKELACSALRGIEATEIEQLGRAFAREVGEKRLRDDTVARLRRHRELGHTVILASASLDPYLMPLGSSLGVDAVVCTVLEQGLDGRLTGRLVGANCRGAEKARRVQEWLRENGLADAELWAYGDSSGDDELLALADHPLRVDGIRVGPEPR